MSGVDLQQALQVSVDAARSAGEVIKAAFYSPKAVEHKGSVDLVTDTDRMCEDIVFSRLKEAFPDHCFIGEETSSAQGFTKELTAAPTWLVDPLDGTTNFVHGFPFVCVSIALAVDTDVVVGVVHNPILGETFTALRGGGACLNSKPISVSKESNLGSALMATEIGVARDDATIAALFDRISKLTAQVRSIRCTGSCACNLASVACGRLDAFFEIGFGGPWDVAAGALLVTEAGGKVLDPAGNPFGVMSRRVLGTNAELGSQIASIIADCKKSPQEPQPLT